MSKIKNELKLHSLIDDSYCSKLNFNTAYKLELTVKIGYIFNIYFLFMFLENPSCYLN